MDQHDETFYILPPPPHSVPWASWVNHVLASRERRLRQIEGEIRAQAAEMERRRLLLEERGRTVTRWMAFFASLTRNGVLVLIGALYLILSYIVTGAVPTLSDIIKILHP